MQFTSPVASTIVLAVSAPTLLLPRFSTTLEVNGGVVMATLAGTGSRLTLFILILNSIACDQGPSYLRFLLYS